MMLSSWFGTLEKSFAVEVKVVSQIFNKRIAKISVLVPLFLLNLQIFIFLSWPTAIGEKRRC